jgi:hypothetical protein
MLSCQNFANQLGGAGHYQMAIGCDFYIWILCLNDWRLRASDPSKAGSKTNPKMTSEFDMVGNFRFLLVSSFFSRGTCLA